MAKSSPFATAPPYSNYHLLYIYNGLIRALEPKHNDEESSSAFYLLSCAHLCKVAQPSRYLRSEPLPILASTERPCIAFVIITVYLTCAVSKLSLWLSGLWLCAGSKQDDPIHASAFFICSTNRLATYSFIVLGYFSKLEGHRVTELRQVRLMLRVTDCDLCRRALQKHCIYDPIWSCMQFET